MIKESYLSSNEIKTLEHSGFNPYLLYEKYGFANFQINGKEKIKSIFWLATKINKHNEIIEAKLLIAPTSQKINRKNWICQKDCSYNILAVLH